MKFSQALQALIHAAASPAERVNVSSESLRMLVNDWGRLDKIVREQEARTFAEALPKREESF